MNQEFLCTRPRLAARLLAKGMEAKQTISPWDARRTVWIFQITPELLSISTEFYENIDKPLPYSLRNYIEGGKE